MQGLRVVVVAEEGAEVRRADDPDGEGHHVVPQREVLAGGDARPVARQLGADGVDLNGWVEHSIYDVHKERKNEKRWL